MKTFKIPGKKCFCGCGRIFPATREDRKFFENSCASKYWRKEEKSKLPPELQNRKPGRPKVKP